MMRFGMTLVLVAEIWGLLLGCGEPRARDFQLGLDHVSLNMSTEEVGRLRSDVESEHGAFGKLHWQGHWYDADISITGKSSLHQWKRNYEMELRDHKLLDRRLVRLTSQGADDSQLRSEIGFYVFSQMGLMVPFMKPVSLDINGELQGVYHFLEPIEKEFFDARGVLIAKLYKAHYGRLGYANFSDHTLVDLKKGFAIKHGPEDYGDLAKLVDLVANADDESFVKGIDELLDVETYLRYLACVAYLDHWDGYINNFYLYRRVGERKFYIVPWDLDKIFPNRGTAAGQGVAFNPYGVLAQRLLSLEPFASRYVELLHGMLEGALSVEHLKAQILERGQAIREAYAADPYYQALGYEFEVKQQELLEWSEERLRALKAEVAAARRERGQGEL